MSDVRAEIGYGKAEVAFYRTYAPPLEGLARIPESDVTRRSNTLFAYSVEVRVFGTGFMASYTEGDNANVVATDSMKNYILTSALTSSAATGEQLLYELGSGFLRSYPQMERLHLLARQLPFAPAGRSAVLFDEQRDDFETTELLLDRSGDNVRASEIRTARLGMRLIKLTGSSFTRFVRDENTTLPERVDRPLFIFLDIGWTYTSAEDALSAGPRYAASEQIADLARVTFGAFNSGSIQHLVHEIGTRALARFPQLASIDFTAQNRLWDTVATSETDERIKVYCDPRPPYGRITLTLRRE